MTDSQFTPQQMERLIAYASGRLGTTPAQLKTIFQQEGVAGLAGLVGQSHGEPVITEKEAAQAHQLLRDKEKAAQLLNDPKVQSLLQQLLGE